MYKWDCIEINGKPVGSSLFRTIEKLVTDTSDLHNVGATEFEILTAIAFEIFKREQIEVAIVEVGLGGRLDATNVLENVICSVITKIGLDHQGFLGNDILEIAAQKAGIMKPGIPVVVDASNEESVLNVMKRTADSNGSRIVLASKGAGIGVRVGSLLSHKDIPLLGSYQLCNVACALETVNVISQSYSSLTPETVARGIRATQWAGRLQWVDIDGERILVDGAHNEQAATLLAEYIDGQVRQQYSGITYMLAFSQGKDFEGIMRHLIQPQDTVVATTFGPVDGMPWVKPCPVDDIVMKARQFTSSVFSEPNLNDAIARSSTAGSCRVVAGSLYLVGDVLRHVAPGPT
jgi:folylpolyglutamate synthase